MRDYRPTVRPEAAFPIRLIALDIDGTLVGPDAELSPRTVAAVRAAVARGVRVSLATGRSSRGPRRSCSWTRPSPR